MAKQQQQGTKSNWPLKNIRVPGDHDVVFGRGGASIHHPGCRAYREMVRAHQRQYIGYDDSRHMKTLLTHELVKKWREQTPPGRFLKKDETTGLWHDVGVASARRKTAQLLREGAKKVRSEMRAESAESASSSEDEDHHNNEYAGRPPAAVRNGGGASRGHGTTTPPTAPRDTATPVTPGSVSPPAMSSTAASRPPVAAAAAATLAPTAPPAPVLGAAVAPPMAAAPPAAATAAASRPTMVARTVSSVERATLSADLRAMVRTAPPAVFQPAPPKNNPAVFQYGDGKPQNSLEMLQIVFEDILDDTKTATGFADARNNNNNNNNTQQQQQPPAAATAPPSSSS